MVVTGGSGMVIGAGGAGGATVSVIALAFGRARGLAAVNGCSDGGAGVALGWAGAAFAVTMGGLGAAMSIPFVVEALSAVAAAEAEAMKAFQPPFFRILEAADLTVDPWSIIRPMRVLASIPTGSGVCSSSSFSSRYIHIHDLIDGSRRRRGSWLHLPGLLQHRLQRVAVDGSNFVWSHHLSFLRLVGAHDVSYLSLV